MRAARKAISLILILLPVLMLCAEGTAEDVHFYIVPVHPSNQRSPENTYFDLRMEPGQRQRLEVQIVNKGEEPLRVQIEALRAHTSISALSSYRADAPEETENPPPVDFAEIVKPEKPTVDVPPNATESCYLDITMPPDPFDGMVHGALAVTEMLDDVDTAQQGSMVIRNQISYVLGIRLTETDSEIEPAFLLENARIDAQDRLVMTVRNPVAYYASSLRLDVAVRPAGGGDPLFTHENRGASMAANSTMDYTLPLGGSELPPGEYDVALTLTTGGQEITLHTPLQIEG